MPDYYIADEADLRCYPNYSVEIGDIDGDGRMEFVCLNQTGNRLRAVRPDGEVVFERKQYNYGNWGTPLVCVADINDAGAQQVVEQILAAGGRAIYVHLDVTDADQWQAAVARTEQEFGSLTILCNNAGANFRVSFDEQTEEMWHLIVETALTGSFR